MYNDIGGYEGSVTYDLPDGYLGVSCNNCGMVHWACVSDPEQTDQYSDSDNGTGQDAMFTYYGQAICPLCDEEEEFEATAHVRIHADEVYDFQYFETEPMSGFGYLSAQCLSNKKPNALDLVAEHFLINVGKGQSSLTSFAKCNGVIYDVGHNSYSKVVIDTITASGSEVSTLIGSHVDDDHIAGIRTVVPALGIQNVQMLVPPRRDMAQQKKLWLYDFLNNQKGTISTTCLQDQPTFMKTENTFWEQYLLLPSKTVAEQAWLGKDPNNASICWLLIDRLRLLQKEKPIWIGITGDRDYNLFMNQCTQIPDHPRSFDVLSLPHHGSNHSTPADTLLVPADYYIVQGYPTGRDSDVKAHLDIIQLVVAMLNNLDRKYIHRKEEATLLFLSTKLTEKQVSNCKGVSRLRIVALEDNQHAKLFCVPIPGGRKVTLVVENPKFELWI